MPNVGAFKEWLRTNLDLESVSFTQPPAQRVATVSRAFLTMITAFVLVHVGLVAAFGYNTGTALFPASVAGCALLLLARWLIGVGHTRTGTWLGTAVPVAIALFSGWMSASIGVGQTAWVFVGVTYCTLVLGFRAGGVAAAISLLAHAVLAMAIEAAQVTPRMVGHPFNQWLNLFTPTMIVLLSTGLIRGALLDSVKRQMESAAAAAEEREERLRVTWDAKNQLEITVRERTAALERAVEDLQTLTYLLSHDLKGKAEVLRIFSQVILERDAQELSDEGRRRLGRIAENAHQLQAMIDGLLAYSRISALAPALQRVSLDALLTSIVHDVQQQFPRSQIVWDSSGEVVSDPVMLRHVFQNLLGNACKHAGASTARVHVSRKESATEDVFCVSDNGPGVPPDDAHRVFGLFQRGPRASAHEGSGVGLAIVKHLVEKLGGRVWVESTSGGARFHFSLPRVPAV